jgi:hypothetical protein
LREQLEIILFGSIQLKDLSCSPFTVVRSVELRELSRRKFMARRSGRGFPELRVRRYVFGRLELFTVQRLLVLHPPADIATARLPD